MYNIFNEQSDLKVSTHAIEALVPAVIAFEGQKCDEVSVYLVDVKEICSLHAEYFDDPSQTDCISFPMDDLDEEGHRILGDIFVCPQTAIEYAAVNHLDPYEELTLYIVHGLLHLMGYDDIDEEDKLLMREAEKRHLIHLKQEKLMLHKEGSCS